MNNDLISREALLKAMEEERQYLLARGQTGAEHIIVHHCLPIIDNAPTVFSCNACKNMGNERECVDCHDFSNYVHYDARPQGEWIDIDGEWLDYKCDKCGWQSTRKHNFCPSCGADMRGGAE